MHELGLAWIPEPLRELLAPGAEDAQRLDMPVIDEPARDLAPFGIEAGDQIAAIELPLDALYTDRQQALALRAQHLRGALVEMQLTANLQLPGDPALARRHHRLRGLEQAADRLATCDLQQRLVDGRAAESAVEEIASSASSGDQPPTQTSA